MNRFCCIVQARTRSTRLPGKILLEPTPGKTYLAHLVERLLRSKRLDMIVLAIPDGPDDNPLAEYIRQQLFVVDQVGMYRGSEQDVLSRYLGAAVVANAQHIVRVTSDCPALHGEDIDRLIEFYEAGDYDLAGREGQPDGLDVEIFTRKALEESHAEAHLPSHREHVSQFMLADRNRYKVGPLKGVLGKDLSHLRLTLDHPQDHEALSLLFTELGHEIPDRPFTDLEAIAWLLLNRDRMSNQAIPASEGLDKSRQEDVQYLANRQGSTPTW